MIITKRCVWNGHVLHKGKVVLAGWCSDKHSHIAGFKGQWKRWMGKQSDE